MRPPSASQRPRRRRLLLGLAASCAVPAVPRAAPLLRLIVPYPAGGTTDQVARLLAEPLGQALQTTVLVDNRPGASGTLGTQALARAAPDGLTVGIGTISTLVLVPRQRDTGYAAWRSFEAVGGIGAAPFLVVAGPGLPVRSLPELVALLAAQPGRHNYGTVGEGSLPHWAGELFQAATGTRIVHVPYPGAPAARLDLIAGRTQLMFDQLATFSDGSLRQGPLHPLAVMGPRRLRPLPQVPTAAEAGVPGLELTMWMGLLAPAGTPPARVEALNHALRASLAQAAVRQALEELGIEPMDGPPSAFRDFVSAELRRHAAPR